MTSPHWDPDLAAALHSVREADQHLETPPHVEAALLAAWDRAHPPRPVALARRRWQRVAAVAAAGLLGVALGQLGRALQETLRPSPAPVNNSDTLLLVGEPILQGEPVRVVRMRVPASTLTGLGVRPAEMDAAAHVDVDVIVGEDGVARAVRLGM
jgi:hypothetical protein